MRFCSFLDEMSKTLYEGIKRFHGMMFGHGMIASFIRYVLSWFFSYFSSLLRQPFDCPFSHYMWGLASHTRVFISGEEAFVLYHPGGVRDVVEGGWGHLCWRRGVLGDLFGS